MLQIDNPYGDLVGGSWIKGNLHAHSTRSDGDRPPQEVLDSYARLGHDFLSLSEHDLVTGVEHYGKLTSHGLILVPGNEITANGPHILHVGAVDHVRPSGDRQLVLDTVGRKGGFAMMCHPNWLSNFNHCSFEQMGQLRGYAGIEIFNGSCYRDAGSPYAIEKWVRVLSTGRRVWGFANDDSHLAGAVEDGLGWNVAYVRERTPGAVVDALVRGRFYASTGVVIEDISVDKDRITVRSANSVRISAHIHDGIRLKYADAPELSVVVPPDARFVRFECWGHGEMFAWTQPFFVTAE